MDTPDQLDELDPAAGDPPATPPGIRCPQCGCRHHDVFSTRHHDRPPRTVRRRTCRCCGRRFTTVERLA